MKNSRLQTILLNVGVGLVYIISGKIGLTFAEVHPSATAIWPPTGIALASFLIFGYRIAPAIFLGAFLVNITTAGNITTSFGIALGNTLEGILGAYLVKRFANGKYAFDTVSNIFKFVFWATIISTSVSATIGFISLTLGGFAKFSDFGPIWSTWWLGDMGGSLVVAPLLLVWGNNPGVRFTYEKTLHFLISFVSLFLITELVFTGIIPYAYLCIPIAVWIALWFEQKGATFSTLFVALIAIYYTFHHQGPFVVSHSINQSLLLLQMFLGVYSVTALTFAAATLIIKKSEGMMQSHEQRFRALIENSFDAVVLIDATSKILYASPSVKRVLGYTQEEIQGKTGFDLVAPVNRDMTMQTLAQLVLKPGGVITVEYQTIRKDKKLIWVEATGTNMLLEPSVNAVVVNFHDITEKKLAHEKMLKEKKQDEAMLASIGDGIIATDSRGKITMINHTASETLGWQRKEIVGKLLVEAIPMQDEMGKIVPISDRPMTKVLTFRKETITSQTNYYIKNDKTKLPIRFTVTPIILDNKLIGTIEVFHDISKEKELDNMKDEFISIASHELRTPMTAVNGLVTMILKGDYGLVNDKLKKPLENIHLSAERQIHLINDLLNVSRLQTGRIDLKLTNFPLRLVLDDIVKLLMPLALQKGINLTINTNEEMDVQADLEWTKNILNNLLGNALKFTNVGKVSVSYEQFQNYVLIAVTDTGMGIAPGDQNKLFGKFQQLSTNISNKPIGSGLGLFLSREIARQMGGDIRLDKSSLGIGSTFIFSLLKAHTNTAASVKEHVTNEIKIAYSKNSV